MALLYGHDKSVAKWVGEKCRHPYLETYLDSQPIMYRAIGVLDGEGTLIGGYVFTGHNGSSIELSLAGRGVLNRDGWKASLDYVFGELSCARLQAHTRRSNKKVLRQLTRLGFRHEGTARRYYGSEDAICYSLTVDDLATFREKWKI